MLPLTQKIAFLIFAALAFIGALWMWRGLYKLIALGQPDSDQRFDRPVKRILYALATTLTQSRTFRKRPVVSFLHSFIFYGFVFYLLVNLVDAVEGFVRFSINSSSTAGAIYNLCADFLSALVLFAVVALVVRRFVLPSRKDFAFNERTLLHPAVKSGYVRFDSIVVSAFILFHVGSRAVAAAAKLALQGTDSFQPFASLLSHAFSPAHAETWHICGYWGALGSVLAFLPYFPRTKHIHIFLTPVKYAVARNVSSGVLPLLELDGNSDEPQLGASRLEELAWPRLLDAYACIQCNRCQDVCPATATGKSLSPSALEINKRMELNDLQRNGHTSASSAAPPLLDFVLTPEAAWACTTCGACMQVCPVQDEPMLDIIDIRRKQVMVEGAFPAQLQSAFRGMERSNNPWWQSQDKRLDWAEGLNVPTTDENPEPDVLYWVGCAASYDPQAQKTARAFVQLLDRAEVNFAVLGKRECCTGDSARRAGNEYLYRELADKNIATLNTVRPKVIVATCPHCMNAVGKEYAQLGGGYKVIHHSEYLDGLVSQGKLQPAVGDSQIAFHDPCYLGRHNGVYDAPRNVLKVLSSSVVELDRTRENSFCCGAGGAQFWKEEEPGDQRISDNRYAEAQQKLSGQENGVLAVGCPFCKSMLQSTPQKSAASLEIKDIAELLLESLFTQSDGASELSASAVLRGKISAAPERELLEPVKMAAEISASGSAIAKSSASPNSPSAERKSRKKWMPARTSAARADDVSPPASTLMDVSDSLSERRDGRQRWQPRLRFHDRSANDHQQPSTTLDDLRPHVGETLFAEGSDNSEKQVTLPSEPPPRTEVLSSTTSVPVLIPPAAPAASSEQISPEMSPRRKRWKPKRNLVQ